jgi:hypothetical protein
MSSCKLAKLLSGVTAHESKESVKNLSQKTPCTVPPIIKSHSQQPYSGTGGQAPIGDRLSPHDNYSLRRACFCVFLASLNADPASALGDLYDAAPFRGSDSDARKRRGEL